jgi:carbon storage regulator
MLVLTRKLGEQIVVPDCDLVLTIVAVQGDKVRVGITAPPELQVHRREVWERIKAEKTAAAEATT